MDQGELFGKIYEFSDIGITVYENDTRVHPDILENFYPIEEDENLRRMLTERAKAQQAPVIYIDDHNAMFGCILWNNRNYFFGPVAAKHLNRVELHQYYFSYGLKKGEEKAIPVIATRRFIAFMQVMQAQLTGNMASQEQILEENRLIEEDSKERELAEKRKFADMSREDAAHHTYQEERLLLNAVREGRVEDALRLNSIMDAGIGIMSKDEVLQWRKLVTVAIALSTRAAIEGGVTPQAAYECSDIYNQRIDECRNVPELIRCRNQAVRELATMVHEKQMSKKTSGYVERCCDYINKHYKEKIYLDDIADQLGISPSYLSRLFVQEKEMKLQDYIVQVRVDRAANLLTYSEESLSAIGDYVNFPSQSYFGKVFKKYKGMTPKEYRERYKPREF